MRFGCFLERLNCSIDAEVPVSDGCFALLFSTTIEAQQQPTSKLEPSSRGEGGTSRWLSCTHVQGSYPLRFLLNPLIVLLEVRSASLVARAERPPLLLFGRVRVLDGVLYRADVGHEERARVFPYTCHC